jgi:hypothetical protein
VKKKPFFLIFFSGPAVFEFLGVPDADRAMILGRLHFRLGASGTALHAAPDRALRGFRPACGVTATAPSGLPRPSNPSRNTPDIP